MLGYKETSSLENERIKCADFFKLVMLEKKSKMKTMNILTKVGITPHKRICEKTVYNDFVICDVKYG